jgi:hypothetical protein
LNLPSIETPSKTNVPEKFHQRAFPVSVRLCVVLCQSSGGGSTRQDLEGALVAHLIGAPGIDLHLVCDLNQLASSHEMASLATDRLVLEGIQGDFALLAWDTPEKIQTQLAGLGIRGHRAPHSLDNQAPLAENLQLIDRKIYCVPLSGQTCASITAGLQQLLTARRTKTVSLAIPARADTTSAGTSRASMPAHAPPLPLTANPQPISAPPTQTARQLAPPLSLPSTSTPRDEWDDLVDDLNASDI